jgi:hypothetical protein
MAIPQLKLVMLSYFYSMSLSHAYCVRYLAQKSNSVLFHPQMCARISSSFSYRSLSLLILVSMESGKSPIG